MEKNNNILSSIPQQKMWKAFITGYEICKETCEMRSLPSSHIFGTNVTKRDGKILTVQKGGNIIIKQKSYRPEVVYKETYGVEFKKIDIPDDLELGHKYKCGDNFTWECVYYIEAKEGERFRMEMKDLCASESLYDFFSREDIERIR
jgi:hypothetical protein